MALKDLKTRWSALHWVSQSSKMNRRKLLTTIKTPMEANYLLDLGDYKRRLKRNSNSSIFHDLCLLEEP